MNNRQPLSNTQCSSQRPRVFVSYYHKDDQGYRDHFEQLFSNIHDIMASESVEIGNIDDINLSEQES